ncbi:MAG: hybrid sensor histidine kinase/response regulator [Candidatus Tectomicrobia bacterium]|nr:hybrid sensor histidine kinase/response regulator [Candidatus Tectomicrobia bacterium]
MTLHDRILIVDDHPGNVEILEDILADDYPLATASSGEDALILARTFRPALILLDIMMPGMDGYDTCRRLREMPTLRHTKIVMVSAKAMVNERLYGYEAGADDYVTKPFDLDELRAKVRVYLRLKSVEELDQLKSDVLSLLSHETATPLNGILGPLQLLRETLEMDTEQIEYLDIAYQSAERLHTLYTKVCTLSALRAGQWTLIQESADLQDVVDQAVQAVAQTATASHVQIDLTRLHGARVPLDRTQMQDVVMTLLDNAIRVSPPASQVAVRLWREVSHLCLSVSDQGPGIAPVFLPQVFEPFAHADMRHHTGGHGLSLPIAQQIVEAHGGAIEVRSVQEEGTVFTVRLPVMAG